MWTYALSLGLGLAWASGRGGGGLGCIWVFDDFEFVLLVGVEEAVEGGGGEEERFGD